MRLGRHPAERPNGCACPHASVRGRDTSALSRSTHDKRGFNCLTWLSRPRRSKHAQASRLADAAAVRNSSRLTQRPNLLQRDARSLAASTAEEYRTFTNPKGNVVNQIADNVWGAERPFIWNTIDVNGRMAILRLKDGTLWVHSPVGLDSGLQQALKELGEVKHVVSPNYEHVSFAKQWQEAYPEAKLYACPGLSQKKPEVRFDYDFSPDEKAPPAWLGEVECTCLSYERNPFTGKPFFNEVVFFHKPSKFLIVSDFFWNYPDKGTQLGTQAWKFGMDRVYGPFYRSFMIREKRDFEVAKQRMFDEWDFEGIIPCHGDVIFSGGKQIVKKHLGLQ